MLSELAGQSSETSTLMIDATHLHFAFYVRHLESEGTFNRRERQRFSIAG